MAAVCRLRRISAGAGLVLSGMLLAGCAPAVDLNTRPADSATAEALARRVADAGHCRSVEADNAGADFWTFSCQDGPHTFHITAVASEAARAREARRMQAVAGIAVPVRGGDFYLVHEGLRTREGGKSMDFLQPDPRELDRFPGTAVEAA